MKKQTKQRTKAVKRNQRAGAAKRTRSRTTGTSALPAATAMPEGAKAGTASPAPKESKKAIVLGLLTRDGGATLQELQDATGWQAHSVRGFISGTLRKAMHLSIERAKRHDGTPIYRVQAAMTA